MVVEDITNCIKHPGKKSESICMDPYCQRETTSACIICIKNDHKKCKSEFILNKQDFKNLIVVTDSNAHSAKYIDSVADAIDDKISAFNQKLEQKQHALIESISLKPGQQKLTLDDICNMKKHLSIKYNKETERIEVGSKIDINEDNFDSSVEKFNGSVKKALDKCLEDFKGLKFTVVGQNTLSPDDWKGHANIHLESDGNGLKVSRAPNGDNTFTYFTALWQNPLPDSCSFRLTITGIYEPDRFLDWGIVNKTKFDSITSGDYRNSWASGGISFCGYNYSGGLSGTSRTTGSNDAKGYKIGDSTVMEYVKGQEIKFYSDDLTNNLSMKNLPNEDHYMYFVVYHPQASGIMEMLS